MNAFRSVSNERERKREREGEKSKKRIEIVSNPRKNAGWWDHGTGRFARDFCNTDSFAANDKTLLRSRRGRAGSGHRAPFRDIDRVSESPLALGQSTG